MKAFLILSIWNWIARLNPLTRQNWKSSLNISITNLTTIKTNNYEENNQIPHMARLLHLGIQFRVGPAERKQHDGEQRKEK